MPEAAVPFVAAIVAAFLLTAIPNWTGRKPARGWPLLGLVALWLAARAQNLGLGMVSILDPARVEALLGMPEDWRFVAWLCIGHPAFEDDLPLLHRVDWQENAEPDWVTL